MDNKTTDRKERDLKKVLIEWVDSNIQHGWQSNTNDCNVALTEEVGYLVQEDTEKIIVARGYSQYGFYNSPMAIPIGCIKSIRELRLK